MEETPEFIKKQLFEFRKIYRNWFKEISDSFPLEKKEVIKYYKDHMNDQPTILINNFFNNVQLYIESISDLDYSFFDNCPEFFKDINYAKLFNSEEGKSETLRKSQIAYITKLTYMSLMLIDVNKDNSDNANVEKYGSTIIKLLTNIQTLDGTNMETMMKNLENAMSSEAFNEADKKVMQDNPLLTDLAEEIFKEVTIPDKFKNMTNPQDIFKLMFDKEGKQFMEGMVKTVGEKIQGKIKSGSISEKDLIGQAQKMMSVFKDNPMLNAMAPGMNMNIPQEQTEEEKVTRKEELKKKLRDNMKNKRRNR